MKKGLTLTELAQKIEANRELKHDFLAPTEQLELTADEDGTVSLLAPDPYEPAVRQPYPILGTGHDQIGGRTGVPAKYYDRMLKEAPDLLVRNVNTWFNLRPEVRMVRTLGGDVRAFLSNRYNRIDNEEIAEVALPILMDIPDVQVVSAEVTERRMYIQATTPRLRADVKVGDTVQAGVFIANSEIGHGSVTVGAMDYRLQCLNGMVSADKFRAYHVGRQIQDNEALWADDTRQADDRAILLKVRDMVRAAVDEVRFRERIAKMAELAGSQTARQPERAVEVLAKKVGATEDERGGILAALIRGGDLSAWGFTNAVTAQAHEARDYDRAVDFEVAGGRLLEMNKKEWREVLEAA